MDPTDKRAVYLKRMGYQLDDSQGDWVKNSAGRRWHIPNADVEAHDLEWVKAMVAQLATQPL